MRARGALEPLLAESILIDGDNPGAERLRQMGELTYLFFRNPIFANLPLHQARRQIQPPVDLDQFVIFRDGERPRAAITWAFLSEAAEARFLATKPLEPREWRSGTRMWVMDMISTFPNSGGAKAARWFLNSIPGHVKRLSWIRAGGDSGSRKRLDLTREDGRWHLAAICKIDLKEQ